MTSLLEALTGASAADPDTFRPVLFRRTVADDRARLEDLLKRDPRLTVHDTLMPQVRELVKALAPSEKFAPEALHDAALAHINGCAPEDYGVWAYYPWSHRLVHLLDEAEFALVRTDRNRNKITREEQAVLATKRVGIIGLSVGRSAALALALERGFGELRIADFDTLDLSNLNRLSDGVHHLGVNKAVLTARQIAELDPYLRVTLFQDGITEANLEAFLTAGGKLDLLIEECDSVAVKIQARLAARAHRIPVVMDTSDRGLIDVERFDLEPERPIMHGRLEGMPYFEATPSSPKELQMDLLMAMVDADGLSGRMKQSITEIGSTIATWPQLGGHIMLGGALTAEVARGVFLAGTGSSGRWYIDLEERLSPACRADSAPTPEESAMSKKISA